MIGMKLQKNMKKLLILCSIFLAALIIRFYNFENRIIFGSEQARSLYVAASYLKEKPSLLGQEYFRANSLGHKLYASSFFNYSLVPFLLLFKFNPIPITYYFAFLNLVTGLVVFLVANKIFINRGVALFALILFLFNSYMIYHSMFIWILNYLPLVGVLSFYLSYKIIKNKENFWDVLFLGILSGIGFGFEYLYVIAIFIIFFILIKYSKDKFKNSLIFIFGGGLGDITQIVFDLKHNFYHFKTLWQYTLDTFNGVSDAGFTYYHFLWAIPILSIIGSLILFTVYKKNKLLGIFMFFLYLFINLDKPFDIQRGPKVNEIIKASQIITNDINGNFNVVTLYDFDTRGYVLRYLLKYVYNKNPLGEIDYPSSNVVYALANKKYDFYKDNPWELNVIKPYNIASLGEIGDRFGIYKLIKR